MRRALLVVYFLSLCFFAHAQSYQWATGGGSSSDMGPYPGYEWETVQNAINDANGNLYVTSPIGTSNIKADTFYMLAARNTYPGTEHNMIASYRCDGSMRWAKLIECSDNQMFIGSSTYSNCALAYSNGSVYTSMVFYGEKKYIGYDTTFTDSALSFMVRFDTSGKLKWVRPIGPDSLSSQTLATWAGLVAADAQGYIHNFVFIKSGLAITSTYTTDTTGTFDVKFDSIGNIVSVARVHLDSVWAFQKVIFTPSGKYYALLGPSDLYWPYTYYNSVVCAFSPAETMLWRDTTQSFIYVRGMDYKGGDAIYLAGGGPDSFSIGGRTVADTIHPIYNVATVTRLDTNGVAKWIYNLQSNQSIAWFGDVTILPNGLIAAIGTGGDTCIHGTDTLWTPVPEYSNPYVLIVDTNGHTMKLDQLHGPDYDYGYAISSDSIGNVYLCGQVVDSIGATGHASYVSNGGNTDFFVVKYGFSNCDSVLPTPPHPGAVGTVSQYGVDVYPNPVSNELIISHALPGSTVILYNVMGQQLYKYGVNNGEETIDTKNLAPGTYLLQITTPDGSRTVRTIIRR